MTYPHPFLKLHDNLALILPAIHPVNRIAHTLEAGELHRINVAGDDALFSEAAEPVKVLSRVLGEVGEKERVERSTVGEQPQLQRLCAGGVGAVARVNGDTSNREDARAEGEALDKRLEEIAADGLVRNVDPFRVNAAELARDGVGNGRPRGGVFTAIPARAVVDGLVAPQPRQKRRLVVRGARANHGATVHALQQLRGELTGAPRGRRHHRALAGPRPQHLLECDGGGGRAQIERQPLLRHGWRLLGVAPRDRLELAERPVALRDNGVPDGEVGHGAANGDHLPEGLEAAVKRWPHVGLVDARGEVDVARVNAEEHILHKDLAGPQLGGESRGDNGRGSAEVGGVSCGDNLAECLAGKGCCGGGSGTHGC